MAQSRPYPWHLLESTSRAEVSAIRRAQRWVSGEVQLAAARAAVAEMVSSRVDVTIKRACALSLAPPLDGGIAVWLARADEPSANAGVLLEVERSLATAVIARAIKRPAPGVVDSSRDLAASAVGAFAAIVLAATRRGCGAGVLRVVTAGPAASIEETLPCGAAAADCGWIAIALTVLLDDDAFAARLVIAVDTTSASPQAPWSTEGLANLGHTPLSIPVVACAVPCTAAEVAALNTGDVFLPGTWPLNRASDGELRGLVFLAAPSSSMGLRAVVSEGRRLVLSGGAEPLWAAEANMADADERGALLEAIGDVPVIVRVEVGEAQMAARDWATLGRGDVVTLGRRVGEPVVLRVGGVAVARGQLVDVEGEVGVRIGDRIAGTAKPA
ncbi:MAG: FliM/FliN family flagellar motor switch protein [Polyangiaceae bacterium]